ncbi:MAG: hypothetical protein ACK41T_02265 [Pseudobdellovibrio sp.]
MKFFLILSFALIKAQVLQAKVICAGDCQGVAKSKPRQEQTPAIKPQPGLIIEDNTSSKEMPLVGKNHGKKYIAQKYFSDSGDQSRSISSHGNISEEITSGESNLPQYFAKLSSNSVENVFVVLPKSAAQKKLDGLSSGSILKIIIKQDIVASSRVPTPVVGIVVSGLYKDSKVYGEAILDDELKRILFNFKTISGGSILSEYSLKASGLDVLGRVGMKGSYHADDITFGIASFFATATAIAADSQVERSKNSQGDYVENPSAENATKKGVAGALGKVAERLSNRAMNAPGRTEVEGPLLVQLVLDEAPYLKK